MERPLLLFQGDSITDAQRNRADPHALGCGYANIVSSALLFRYPDTRLRVANRGVSGNRTRDLLERWQSDCIDLAPTFFSLMIGINNTWRRFDRDDPTPADTFERELNELLDRLFTETSLRPENAVLLEPFLLDSPPGSKTAWFEDLRPKQDAVRRAAETHSTHFVPLQAMFDDACERAPADHWAPDGVHPSPAGHHLIAQAWLHALEDRIPTR